MAHYDTPTAHEVTLIWRRTGDLDRDPAIEARMEESVLDFSKARRRLLSIFSIFSPIAR